MGILGTQRVKSAGKVSSVGVSERRSLQIVRMRLQTAVRGRRRRRCLRSSASVMSRLLKLVGFLAAGRGAARRIPVRSVCCSSRRRAQDRWASPKSLFPPQTSHQSRLTNILVIQMFMELYTPPPFQGGLLLFRKKMEGHCRHCHHRWGVRGGQPGLPPGQKRPEGCGAAGEVRADGWIHLARRRCSCSPQVCCWSAGSAASPHDLCLTHTLSKKCTKYAPLNRNRTPNC